MSWDEEREEDDWIMDEINGARNKKPKMALLNKKKISRYELDDLMNELG